MIRTQVNLDEQDYNAVKKAAKKSGISMAEFIRGAVRDALPVADKPVADKPWMRFAGMVASGDPESSQHIDEVVYGIKR